jgi:hypothetical protein
LLQHTHPNDTDTMCVDYSQIYLRGNRAYFLKNRRKSF